MPSLICVDQNDIEQGGCFPGEVTYFIGLAFDRLPPGVMNVLTIFAHHEPLFAQKLNRRPKNTRYRTTVQRFSKPRIDKQSANSV